MKRNILVPLDGSKESEAILPQLRRISTARDQVHFLHVVPPLPASGSHEPAQHDLIGKGETYLEMIRERLFPSQPGLNLVTMGDPAEEILRVALEKNITMIAMSTHRRRTLGRLLMGSVASEVVKKAQLPVLLVRPDHSGIVRPLRRILVAVEGAAPPQELLETVKVLAGASKAELVLFHAVLPVHDPAPQWATTSPLNVLASPEHHLQELADLLENEGYCAWPVVSTGNPQEEILSQIQKLDIDLVALSTHARSGLEKMMEGSVAESVLFRSPVAVLLQRPPVARKAAVLG